MKYVLLAFAAAFVYLSGWERGFDAARELFEPGATG